MTDVIFAAKASNGYDADFMELCREELRVTPADIDAGTHWVAATSDKILGTVCLTSDAHGTGIVQALFVAPDSQGSGIGRALWDRAVTAARTTGLARLHLDADPQAAPFYAAMGCRTIGKSRSGSIPDRMLPLMEFVL